MKRAFDFVASLIGLILLAPFMAAIAVVVKLDSEGPAIFWSQRFGAHGRLFTMPKFRTMRLGTEQLPTHLLVDADARLTRVGGFLRRSSLDELPQLWSVLRGDMSLVGPRPALFNQGDLLAMRTEAGVAPLRPGVTGWAQVNGRDELALAEKVAYEAAYLARRSFLFDLWIIGLTIIRVFRGSGITH